MPLIDRLESRFGWIAIPGAVRVLAGFQLLTFFLISFNPALWEALVFDPEAIFKGQIWRLFTIIFIPRVDGFWIIIVLMFMWFLGNLLEAQWGAFRLTLYLLGGIVAYDVGGFLIYFASPEYLMIYNIVVINNALVATSLLLAVGVLYPNVQINFMFVIPIKLMWLALFRGGLIVLDLLRVTGVDFWLGAAFLIATSNFLVAFGPSSIKNWKQRNAVASRRRRFELAKTPEHEALHRCEVCGKTEHDDPDLEFRVAADGEEYCREHLPGSS